MQNVSYEPLPAHHHRPQPTCSPGMPALNDREELTDYIRAERHLGVLIDNILDPQPSMPASPSCGPASTSRPSSRRPAPTLPPPSRDRRRARAQPRYIAPQLRPSSPRHPRQILQSPVEPPASPPGGEIPSRSAAAPHAVHRRGRGRGRHRGGPRRHPQPEQPPAIAGRDRGARRPPRSCALCQRLQAAPSPSRSEPRKPRTVSLRAMHHGHRRRVGWGNPPRFALSADARIAPPVLSSHACPRSTSEKPPRSIRAPSRRAPASGDLVLLGRARRRQAAPPAPSSARSWPTRARGSRRASPSSSPTTPRAAHPPPPTSPVADARARRAGLRGTPVIVLVEWPRRPRPRRPPRAPHRSDPDPRPDAHRDGPASPYGAGGGPTARPAPDRSPPAAGIVRPGAAIPRRRPARPVRGPSAPAAPPALFRRAARAVPLCLAPRPDGTLIGDWRRTGPSG